MKKATETETDRFHDLLDLEGHTIARAAAVLTGEGYPDRGVAFWKAERRQFWKDVRELNRIVAENTGPDGEIYGHRD